MRQRKCQGRQNGAGSSIAVCAETPKQATAKQPLLDHWPCDYYRCEQHCRLPAVQAGYQVIERVLYSRLESEGANGEFGGSNE